MNTAQPVLYLTRDLMFSSRVSMSAERGGYNVKVLSSLDALTSIDFAHDVQLVMIDLELIVDNVAEHIAMIRTACPTATLLGYAGHVKENLLNAARETGDVVVWTRGQFNKQFDEALRTYCA
jgi:ActR/RegA family two-component response regulator